MKKVIIAIFFLIVFVAGFLINERFIIRHVPEVLSLTSIKTHWLVLQRKSNVEYLYFGTPGDKYRSQLLNIFRVKTGTPGQKPTPLPSLLGREYWVIIDKMESGDNPETAPYFLTLDVPVTEFEPYGPSPYLECNGQCNWILPGYFGLHGVNGDDTKLSKEDGGSSGCVRHSDSDITYLYNILDPKKEEVRYYVEDI